MRTAIYLRQSLDKTGEGLAVDRQRQDCEKEATHRGWEIVGTFVDNDVSASSRKPRPAYERMLEEVRAGRVDAVLVWDLDRLTRRPIEVEDWIRLHERHGVNLVTISEHIDLSTDNGRMYLRIKVAVARAEVERKAARQRRANLQAARDGRRMGGRRPFGFELDMTIREAEAAAIRQAYQDVLAGVSLGQIARDWNAAGFCTPLQTRKGEPSPWIGSSVRPVLMNPRNAGIRGYGPKLENGSRTIEEMGKAKWDAIVSEETWRAVVGVLSDPDRFAGGSRGARALLTGVAECGICGATVNGARARTGKRIYRCSGAYGHICRAAEPIEQWVSEVAIARLSREDATELLRDDERPDVEALRTEAAARRKRLDQLTAMFMDGELTQSEFRRERARAQSKLATIEARMADAGRTSVLKDLVQARDLRAVWGALSTERQRAVVDALMVVKIMSPGRGRKAFNPESVIIEPRI